MSIRKPHLPYFDSLFSIFSDKNSAITRAFCENVHWGYWEIPHSNHVSAEEYFTAARNLSQLVINAADIEDGHLVLDVACGLGGTINLILEKFARVNIIGLNIDIRQLQYASQNISGSDNSTADFLCADANSLPFPDNSIDRITCVEAVFHFSSRKEFFNEAFRILKPGGYLALSDFVPIKQIAPDRWFAWKRIEQSFFGDFDLRYTIEDYHKLAKNTGFNLHYEKNITKNTLPTYKFLSDNAKEFTRNSSFSRFQISVLAMFSRLSLLKYYVLSFRKAA